MLVKIVKESRYSWIDHHGHLTLCGELRLLRGIKDLEVLLDLNFQKETLKLCESDNIKCIYYQKEEDAMMWADVSLGVNLPTYPLSDYRGECAIRVLDSRFFPRLGLLYLVSNLNSDGIYSINRTSRIVNIKRHLDIGEGRWCKVKAKGHEVVKFKDKMFWNGDEDGAIMGENVICVDTLAHPTLKPLLVSSMLEYVLVVQYWGSDFINDSFSHVEVAENERCNVDLAVEFRAWKSLIPIGQVTVVKLFKNNLYGFVLDSGFVDLNCSIGAQKNESYRITSMEVNGKPLSSFNRVGSNFGVVLLCNRKVIEVKEGDQLKVWEG